MGIVLTEVVKFCVVRPPTTIVYPSGMVTSELSTEFFWLGGGRPFWALPR